MDTRPSTDYHSEFVRNFNADARGRDSGESAGIDLSEQALIEQAKNETGLERFGDESFLPAMRIFLHSVETEAGLNPFGRHIVKARTLRALKNRLWANACFEAHPEIRERKIVAPIIVVGPHRSGTTRMQHLLASDTRLQHLKAWEGMNPAPRPGEADGGKAARYEEAVKSLDGLRTMYPGAFTAHPLEADWPEEEMLLLNQSFCGFLALGLYHIPGYYRWFINADKSWAYREMADLMRLISWSRGDAEDKRWILKNPQHMLDLDILMKVFPDAKIVFTHRDPIKTVGSVMSLMWTYAVQHTDAACRAQTRDVWLDFCGQMLRHCIKQRVAIPPSQQLDVYYADVNRDWRKVMKRVYDFSGMELTAAAEQAMDAWLEKSRSSHRQGEHRYSLEDFGITDAEVDARMMFARERYDIPYEAS